MKPGVTSSGLTCFTATDNNVPCSFRRVKRLTESQWDDDMDVWLFESPFIVGLSDKSIPPEQHQGNLFCLSPIEVAHAFLFKVQHCIVNGASDQTLKSLRNAALTPTYRFVIVKDFEIAHFPP